MVTDWSGGLMHTAWQASDMTLVVKLLVSSMSSGIEASHPATECTVCSTVKEPHVLGTLVSCHLSHKCVSESPL